MACQNLWPLVLTTYSILGGLLSAPRWLAALMAPHTPGEERDVGEGTWCDPTLCYVLGYNDLFKLHDNHVHMPSTRWESWDLNASVTCPRWHRQRRSSFQTLLTIRLFLWSLSPNHSCYDCLLFLILTLREITFHCLTFISTIPLLFWPCDLPHS